MRRTRIPTASLATAAALSALALIAIGCIDLSALTSGLIGNLTGGSDSSGGPPDSGGIASSTVLRSSDLVRGDAAQSTPAVSDTTEGLRITPINVTGKVLSLLFPIDGKEDEGVVVFGNYRPDIAPADSELLPFDMADQLAVSGAVQLKPGFGGGPATSMILLFGYLDIEFELNGQNRLVRVATASVEGMQRGDVLLWFDNTTSSAQTTPSGSSPEPASPDGEFRWYDLDTNSFVSTRPENPVVIPAIRDFFDPIRPNLVFYPISGQTTQTLDLGANVFENAISLNVVLDFALSQFIVLEDQHDPSAIDDATLIQNFNLSITSLGVDFSGLSVDAQVSFDYANPPVADANLPIDLNEPIPIGPNQPAEPNSSATQQTP